MAKNTLGGNWLLSDAAITAVSYQGVPITRSGLSLQIIEGRGEALFPIGAVGEGFVSALTYELAFLEVDAKEPDNSEQAEAAIILTGTTAEGKPCKIWGDGYVGYDNLGQIEGSFWKPPRIELIAADQAFMQLDADDQEAGHGPR